MTDWKNVFFIVDEGEGEEASESEGKSSDGAEDSESEDSDSNDENEERKTSHKWASNAWSDQRYLITSTVNSWAEKHCDVHMRNECKNVCSH